MAPSTWHVYGSIFVYFYLCSVSTKYVNTEEVKRPFFENRPHVTMDFNINIDGGNQDCFTHFVQPDGAFFVSYRVLRGGDGMAGFAVQHPDNRLVHPYAVKDSSFYADDKSIGGYYNFCIDNHSFTSILVELYVSSFKIDGWQKYEKELEELHLNVANFTRIIDTVERNTNNMQQFQWQIRSLESRDIALLNDNYAYVQNWSIAQIIAIVLTCTFQVFFVRRLFDVKTGNLKMQI
ncbi:transmembrane emp24 domain-containing protein 6-like [Bradysia coprophila]|uniref:transmembrane emp24 domain-containing protein 6-like n=1 Tax=Bradysia coprophila TaxID=38358 RepID=UPI00187D98CF|nr:transmembrane emp24 domain-containing protein 6-like [Bradysia coprophila]